MSDENIAPWSGPSSSASLEDEPGSRIDGILVGVVVGAHNGAPLIDHPANPDDEPVAARSLIEIGPGDIGRPVALAFEKADSRRPMIIGFMVTELFLPAETNHLEATDSTESRAPGENPGDRLVFEADRELVLRCGKASITLTRAGKVLIRGTYLLSRSSGVNRIKGGSVQIN